MTLLFWMFWTMGLLFWGHWTQWLLPHFAGLTLLPARPHRRGDALPSLLPASSSPYRIYPLTCSLLD